MNEVSQESLQKFYDKVTILAEKMFGRDCDNDLPINIRVVNRTVYEPCHYIDIPYRHLIEEEIMGKLKKQYEEPTAEEIKNAEEMLAIKLEERMQSLLFNLSMATGEVEQEMKLRQFERRKNV